MRGAAGIFLSILLPVTAARAADDCSTLQLLNKVQMVRGVAYNADLVPITIGSMTENFLLDTGGDFTQIGRQAAQDLKLPIYTGKITMYDLTGKASHDEVTVPQFILGRMRGTDGKFPVSPNIGDPGVYQFDGIFAPDYLRDYDADMDFGTDVLNLFSQDHCPGRVIYWKSDAVAISPITFDGGHIKVPVTLDGRKLDAIIDTGATNSTLRMDIAQYQFNLTMGRADTPEGTALNGNTAIKTYNHIFKSLDFDGVAVSNPRLNLIPSPLSNGSKPAVGDPLRAIATPQLIVGMDVLRKLHLYFAFKEMKMYVTAASVQTPEQRALQLSLQPVATVKAAWSKIAGATIERADAFLAVHPNDSSALNARCYARATLKLDLDSALSDCDAALNVMPDDDAILNNRAFTLYQQGKYQDALDGYNAAVSANPQLAAALFMRGNAKAKLGDSAGHDADLAAAKAINPDIELNFKAFDMDEEQASTGKTP